MELTGELIRRCVELHRQHEIPLVAATLGALPLDVCRALRRARVLTSVQPYDLAFIVRKRGAMPDRAIREYLDLTPTQFDQILRRHNLRDDTGTGSVTLETCAQGTRWLIEAQLRWTVDDRLPRRITADHFTDNGLYPELDFATREKAKHSMARHFSACAFLIGHAYPGRFMAWQFRHHKTNRYFSGRAGRRNFLNALLWLVDEKLQIPRQSLAVVASNAGFLNTRCLQDYGLGAHWWRPLWRTKAEMLEALLRHAGVAPRPRDRLTPVRARQRLAEDGVNTARCAVPYCNVSSPNDVQVHHIIRKATRMLRNFDIDAARNLIPLCRHHHGIADRLHARDFDLGGAQSLRDQLLVKLRGMEPEVP